MYRRLRDAYRTNLKTRPILTKCIVTGGLYCAGDIFAQKVVPLFTKQESKPFDYARLIRFSAFGLCLLGPYLHLYFNFLERLIKSPGTKGIVLKVLFDQTVGAGVFCVGFTTYNTLSQGGSFLDVQNELKTTFWRILQANWKVWPLVNAITFGFIPLEHRVLFVNCVAFFWSILLSSIVAK